MFIRQGRAVLDFDREQQTCVVVMFTRIAHRPIANMDNIALHMQLTAGVGMGVKVVYTCERLAVVVISDRYSTAFICGTESIKSIGM